MPGFRQIGAPPAHSAAKCLKAGGKTSRGRRANYVSVIDLFSFAYF
jgi:hypothetical protein